MKTVCIGQESRSSKRGEERKEREKGRNMKDKMKSGGIRLEKSLIERFIDAENNKTE